MSPLRVLFNYVSVFHCISISLFVEGYAMVIFVTGTDSEFIYLFKHSLDFSIFVVLKLTQSVLILSTVLEGYYETV